MEIDIRNIEAPKPISRIRFANDQYGKACFITRKDSGVVVTEDEDRDGDDWPLKLTDVDNFILARAKARELGWNI
jgi:hypothetical protein